MTRLWEGVKRFGNWCVISSVCWWLLVWIVGSWQAGRFLGLDDLIPAANRGLDLWR